MVLRPIVVFIICATIANAIVVVKNNHYDPTWESLDSRPNPVWFDEAKFGIFIHWGVYSVPAHGSEWFWRNWKSSKPDYVDFIKKNYKPGFTYQEFAHEFTAENFKPNEWVQLFERSGAKYIVLTSKHHDGYTLWPSKYSFSWNSVDIGPKRDLVGELATAVRKSNKMRFGLYHSLFEWFNPMYLSDQSSKYNTDEFVEKKVFPEMIELVNKYKPEYLWSDGDWEANATYWQSTKFIAWLFNDSPVAATVLVNDRWGSGTTCKHGSVLTCSDRYHPGQLIQRKWENAMTIDKESWGYRQEADLMDYLSTAELIEELVSTVSLGGNLLLNVGPTKDGRILPVFEERLLNIGNWLHVNGDAIYGAHPWTVQNDTKAGDVWYTSKKTNDTDFVFAIVLKYPATNDIDLYGIHAVIDKVTNVRMLGYDQLITYDSAESHVTVHFPPPIDSHRISELAWTLAFELKG